MLANEYIHVKRETAHTYKHIHAQMNSYRYLEQWFGFPFPPPLSLQSVFEKQGQECASLVGLRFIKSRVYEDNFEIEKTHSVHLTPEASSLPKQPGSRSS